jgi:hypothetical protein
MRGCQGTWQWPRFSQLEYLAAGKTLDNPPKRMCSDCLGIFQNLQDLEMPCKVDDCDRTWMFNRYAQLEHRRMAGDDAEPPSKMCQQCYSFFMRTRDREIRCINRGCSNTWSYTRSMQLHDWRQKREMPQQMCAECQEKLAALQDRQEPCMIPDCKNTWTYAALEQLKDSCQKRQSPASRRCPECETFLAEHKAEVLTCSDCGGTINWSAYEQLLCKVGNFVKPERCSTCAKTQLDQARQTIVPPRQHHLVVRMPSGGRWNADSRISDWPPHLNYEAIARAEAADIRIVALGDELTYSNESQEKSWPWLLEQKLNESLGEKTKVVVINAGIPESTSEQALVRIARDVTPFAPHLVLFSFACADSRLNVDSFSQSWSASLDPEKAIAAADELCRQLSQLDAKILQWTTNPMFPHDAMQEDLRQKAKAWADAQLNAKTQCQAHYLRLSSKYQIPVVDLRSRFEVNGKKSASKWMSDWYRHNESGASHIATWLADHILREKLLPLGQDEA